MTEYEIVEPELRARPRRWLVTGAAGFIGSSLVERLLQLDQEVVGVDNFVTGKRDNLEDVRRCVGEQNWSRFRFSEADIKDLETCRSVCEHVQYVLHHAALGSVPRSLENPIATNEANVDGFLNMLVAARDAKVNRFVYATSSSVYGDDPELPRVEERTGRPLSPYAVSKYVNELYARVFEEAYGLEVLGLRYFNVFGRRQDPQGAYAAVIPRWIGRLFNGQICEIHGDGETSRDFCYVDNAVQANLLAATAEGADVTGNVYNVGCGERTTINELFSLIREEVAAYVPEARGKHPQHTGFRPGDVRHSLADINRIRTRLGYEPRHRLREGLRNTVAWYARALDRLAPHAHSS